MMNNSRSWSGTREKESGVRFGARLLAYYNRRLNVISEYLYYCIVMQDSCPGMSEIYEKLAEIGVEHFKKMGKILYDLGIRPVINTRIKAGSFSCSTGDEKCNGINSLVTETLEGEKLMAKELEEIISECDNSAIAKTLNGILDGHKAHIRLFTNILKN